MAKPNTFYIILIAVACFVIGACSSPALGRNKLRKKHHQLTPELAKAIVSTARSYGLPPQLVLEVLRHESAFDPNARSDKGAAGLMQMMPGTAARFGISDPTDPQQALHGGCRYLLYLIKKFNGRLDLVLAGYNAGEHRVEQYGMQVPPYRETRNYVRAILLDYQRACQLTKSPSIDQRLYNFETKQISLKAKKERLTDIYKQLLSPMR